LSEDKRKSTSTSSFGAPGRESHDSSRFYSSRLYNGEPLAEPEQAISKPVPKENLDRLFAQSSGSMDQLPDYSVHLMVTSPPYNAQKDYDQDLSLDEYRQLLRDTFQETYRVLVTGGRACVNIANLGRKPYLPLHAYLIEDMLGIGFVMRGEIIWDKGSSASSIKRDEFLEWTKSVWSFPAVSARKIGHPAPFPEELPRRLIQLYTFEGDVVLDPFCGSGTTCVAAKRLSRHYVGYDIHEDYLQIARDRIESMEEA
jgi:DNA modification methylase